MDLPKPGQEKRTNLFRQSNLDFPSDLKIAVLWTALCIASIYIPVVNQTFIRLFLSLPLILFIPGYVLLAALFPDSADIDTVERIVLSIGVSVIITPLIGLCLNFTQWGIRLEPILTALTIFIVAMVLVAVIRRTFLIAMIRRSSVTPESRYTFSSGSRYSLPVGDVLSHIRAECAIRNRSIRDRILFFGSIIAICLVILSVFVVIYTPKPGDKFTEFFILGENRTADSYPQVIILKTPYPMYVGIGNHEFRTINYSVEIYLVPKPANETTSAPSKPATLLIKTYYVTLSHNETSVIPFDLIVPNANYNRVDFLLFDETLPGNDITGLNRVNASYRNLHLWFNHPSMEFFILGENRTAAAFPDAINSKTSHTVYVGVRNYEFRMINYTVEMYLGPISVNAPAAARFHSGILPLKTYTVVLNHYEMSVLPLDFSVPDDGDYQMDFLLFNETVPGQGIKGPNRVNASYRNLHLGFNVTSPLALKNTTAIW